MSREEKKEVTRETKSANINKCKGISIGWETRNGVGWTIKGYSPETERVIGIVK